VAVPTAALAASIQHLQADPMAGPVTDQAMTFLVDLFAAGPTAIGATMAGRAKEGIGAPDTVAASVAFLAQDLLAAL